MSNLSQNNKIWACLLHFSCNICVIHHIGLFVVSDQTLELSEALWNDAIDLMAKQDVNMVVTYLGDAVKYENYPEFAVKALEMFDKAQQAVSDDSIYIRRIEKEKFCCYFLV